MQIVSVTIDYDRGIIYGYTEIQFNETSSLIPNDPNVLSEAAQNNSNVGNNPNINDLYVLSIPPLPNSSVYQQVYLNNLPSPFKCYYSPDQDTISIDIQSEDIDFREIYKRVSSTTPSVLVIEDVNHVNVESIKVEFSYELGDTPFKMYNLEPNSPNNENKCNFCLTIGFTNQDRKFSWFPTIPAWSNGYKQVQFEINVRSLYPVIGSLPFLSEFEPTDIFPSSDSDFYQFVSSNYYDISKNCFSSGVYFFTGRLFPHEVLFCVGDYVTRCVMVPWGNDSSYSKLSLTTIAGFEHFLMPTCLNLSKVLESVFMGQYRSFSNALAPLLKNPPFTSFHILFTPIAPSINWNSLNSLYSAPSGLTSAAAASFEETTAISQSGLLSPSLRLFNDELIVVGELSIISSDCLLSFNDLSSDPLVIEKRTLLARAVYRMIMSFISVPLYNEYLKYLLEEIFLQYYIGLDFGKSEQQLVKWASREAFASMVQIVGDIHPLSFFWGFNAHHIPYLPPLCEISNSEIYRLKCFLVALVADSFLSEASYLPEAFLSFCLIVFLVRFAVGSTNDSSPTNLCFWNYHLWPEIVGCYVTAWNQKPQNFAPENQLSLSLRYDDRLLDREIHAPLFRLKYILGNLHKMYVSGTGCPHISLTLLLHLQRKGTAMDYFSFFVDQTPLEPPPISPAMSASFFVSNSSNQDATEPSLDPIDLVGRDGNFTLGFGYVGSVGTEFSIGGGPLWESLEKAREKHGLSGDEFGSEFIDNGLYPRKIVNDPFPISGARFIGHSGHSAGEAGEGVYAPSLDFCKIWPSSLIIDIYEDDGIRRECLNIEPSDYLPKAFQLNPRAERGRKKFSRDGGGIEALQKKCPFIGFSSETDYKMMEWMKNYVTHKIHPEYKQLDNRSLVAKVCSKNKLPVLWTRADPNLHIIGRIRRCQSPSMWEQQLLADNDPIGQIEAALHLGRVSDVADCAVATGAVKSLIAAMSQHLWHPSVRSRAAYSLANIYNNFSKRKKKLLQTTKRGVDIDQSQGGLVEDDSGDEFESAVPEPSPQVENIERLSSVTAEIDEILRLVIRGFFNYFVLHHTITSQLNQPHNKMIQPGPMILQNLKWPSECRFFSNFLRTLCIMRDYTGETPVEVIEIIMRFLDASGSYLSCHAYPILATYLFSAIESLSENLKDCGLDGLQGFVPLTEFSLQSRVRHLASVDSVPYTTRSCFLLTRVLLSGNTSTGNVRRLETTFPLDIFIRDSALSGIFRLLLLGKIVVYTKNLIGNGSSVGNIPFQIGILKTKADEEQRIVGLGIGFFSSLKLAMIIEKYVCKSPFKILAEVCLSMSIYFPHVFTISKDVRPILEERDVVDSSFNFSECFRNFKERNKERINFIGWNKSEKSEWNNFCYALKRTLITKAIIADPSFPFILTLYEFFFGRRKNRSDRGFSMNKLWVFLRRYGKSYTNSPLLEYPQGLPEDWQHVALLGIIALKQRYEVLQRHWIHIEDKLNDRKYTVPMEFKSDITLACRGLKSIARGSDFERNFDAVWHVIIASFKKSVGRVSSMYTPDTLLKKIQEDDDINGEDVEENLTGIKYFWFIYLPNNDPFTWLLIHVGVIFLYFMINVDFKYYDNYIIGAILSILFISFVNYAILPIFLLLRLIVSKVVLFNVTIKTPLLLSFKKTLDPSLTYVIWATFQMLFWQSCIFKNPDDGSFSIYFFGSYTSGYLYFRDVSLKWITTAIYLYPILALRSMCLSIIKFLFEVDILKVCNEPVEKYASMYNKIRKLNYHWLKYVLSRKDIFKVLEQSAKGNKQVCYGILENIKGRAKRRNKKGKRRSTSDPVLDLDRGDFADEWSLFSQFYLNNKYSSKLDNYFILYNVNEMAPVIHLLHQEVELYGGNVIIAAFDSLFNQIYATTTKITIESSQEKEDEKEQLLKRVLTDAVRQSSLELEGAGAGNSHIKSKGRKFHMWCPKYIRQLLGLGNIEKEIDKIEERASSASYQIKHLFNLQYPQTQPNVFLTLSNFEVFLSKDEAREMITWLDFSGHGKIDCKMFIRKLSKFITLWKKLRSILRGQESVLRVMNRLISACLWIITGIVIAVVCEMTIECIVASGATLLSAMTIALSYLYTNFIASVIFVAVSNPYSVGDRIRLNDGEPLIVKNIHTYTTEFLTIEGKLLISQNSTLAGMKITNESRSTNAILEIPLKFDFATTEKSLECLEISLRDYINSHPSDFVKDFVYVFASDLQPGYYYELIFYVKCVEGWGSWQMIKILRTNLIEFLMRKCKELSILYKMPSQELIFPEPLTLGNFDISIK